MSDILKAALDRVEAELGSKASEVSARGKLMVADVDALRAVLDADPATRVLETSALALRLWLRGVRA